VKLNRFATTACLIAAGAIALSACGSDNNPTSAGSDSTVTSSSGASSSDSTGVTTAAGDPTGSTTSSGTGITCATGTLQLSGSTAQTNAMSEWIKNYQTACPGATINYGGGGSGQGVQNFQDGTVDFAGSDFPLADGDEHDKANQRCAPGTAVDLPMVPGPIAIGYNLPGVKDLNLSASTLAGIFSGKITAWNDDAIKKDNPNVDLPSTKIQTFHRSDGSGTSYNFSNYLANEAKSDWSYGANKAWPAPGGVGEKGTAGIAQGVKSTPGGIGYMELSYATQNSISYAKVGNAGGDFVELTTDNVVKFLSTATVVGQGDDLALKFDYTNTDADAYPNLLVTYEIVCTGGKSSELARDFLSYIVSDEAQNLLPDLGYVKLPSNIQTKVQDTIKGLG